MDLILKIERILGFNLPKDYSQFLQSKEFENNREKQFPVIHKDGYKTRGYLEKFSKPEDFFESNQYRSYLKDFVKHFELDKNYVEAESLYHIADCSNGAVCMALNGKHKGKIYSVDNGDFGIIHQSNSLKEFIESLFSSEDVLSSPKEIIKAVKSGDLKEFKNQLENLDGNKILSTSSKLEIEIFDLAYKNNQKDLLKYFISQGYDGFGRVEYYKLKV